MLLAYRSITPRESVECREESRGTSFSNSKYRGSSARARARDEEEIRAGGEEGEEGRDEGTEETRSVVARSPLSLDARALVFDSRYRV